MIAAAIAGAALAYNWRDGGAHLGWRPISSAAAQVIRNCPGPIFNTYEAGGVLIWFVPEQPVFVDGRVEVYPGDFLERSRRADLYGDYSQLFEDFHIQCAVVPTNSPMADVLGRDGAMRSRFSDSQWTVFASATPQGI